MATKIVLNDITIRTILQPGDLGYVIYRHGKLYSEQYNYSIAFETYVAAGIYEFYKNYDAALDSVWICEYNNKIIGFLLLMHRQNNSAQLRYFYLEPAFRNLGLGKKLMNLFMDFLLERQYGIVFLWTTNEQDAAAALYKKYGFILTEEKASSTFGKPLIEQRYQLLLAK